jgi:two-component system phosphate regulon sensor histidine kinase PhoR
VARLPEVTETLAAAVREGKPRVSEIRRPDRPRDRVLRLHASPLEDAEGGPAGAVLVLHDITELRALEEVRRDFVANASHELKTPVAAIRGLAETILDDPAMDAATRKRFVESIGGQASRMAALVEEMLALSRLEGSGAAVPRAPVDAREPVREALQAVQPLAKEKGLALEADLPDDPATVLGTAEALRRIAGNLLDNALKYTPAPGRVRLYLAREGDRWIIAVEDTGPGIPKAERERIFERFYRLDKGRGRDSGGVGLGLAIVKHLVLALGGTVSVADGADGGSAFRVSLPAA